MIFPAGPEGVIPISPGTTETRVFELRERRYSVTISRDESGFYELTVEDITDAIPRQLSHVSEILTEKDLDGIYQATIADIK